MGLRSLSTFGVAFGISLVALEFVVAPGSFAALGSAAMAQAPTGSTATHAPAPSQTAVNLAPPLLPDSFVNFRVAGDTAANAPEPAFSIVNANKAALEECVPQRSAVKNYTSGAKTIHVEAAEFKDASGALAAFSVLSQPGLHEVKDLGVHAEEGNGGVLFVTGASLAVAFPASSADLTALKALANVMPKPVGAAALQPLLPTLLPSRGLQPGTIRYALGPDTYMAEGGVLPANGLGWEQSLEAVTAKYSDRRGAETLTLLLYPTPTVAGAHLRRVDAMVNGLGPSFAKSKTRREGSLLVIANGTFSLDAAQALVENTHIRQIVSTDKAMPTPEVIETRHTFGTLANIIVFSGMLCGIAVLTGLFLGGGRALIRIMQGKPPATEAEFLSLHLDPQNPTPHYTPGRPAGPV